MRKVVLDTNVLLVSISDRSKLHWIFTVSSLLETKSKLMLITRHSTMMALEKYLRDVPDEDYSDLLK